MAAVSVAQLASIKAPFTLTVPNRQSHVTFQQSKTIYPTHNPQEIFTLPAKPLLSTATTTTLGPDIISPLTLPSSKTRPTKSTTFLCLPPEIRRLIYILILNVHPLKHPDITPPPHPNLFPLKPHERLNQALKPQGLSYTDHSFSIGYIPTALLLTNHQIYLEARTLPFEVNTWVFVNRYGSGLRAANRFWRALKEWQRDAVRVVDVRVVGNDVLGAEWREFCWGWKGVRGVRLGVSCWVGRDWGWEWVESLTGIEGLRWVDVCVDAGGGEGEGKRRRWVRELERVVNDGREGHEVRVRLVEGVK
ncbi:hypothetical protein GLAREA_11924 [Glarea lozoyensis ATCC 20868]|uniref:Uncharacterized protein n=1 Tax=Glarea lozoyensis (strain ATCC 20868 / MF5171) TaxID=1116229 RepID=S3D008_GLAL2|nr:uncharacterized protein GLAREA_11924 [Glarea lozoyensis ATCC 20868]EPE31842.1 hypothetical protein GLAREA_11924 [Glarea lozoyensis ATCC 20868]